MNNIPSTTSIFLSRQHLLHPTEKMTGKEARDLASASTEEKVMIAVAYTLIALTGIGLIAIGVYFWKARAKVTQLKTSDFPRVPRPPNLEIHQQRLRRQEGQRQQGQRQQGQRQREGLNLNQHQ